ncbi:DNA N6-methyl adenine demethylase [Caerostris extrusa]|uniref:Methylcytosine dioxygenase TET n=1 Tax=Caerostris extrusa TaxID=172846 RepID=A0AAV4NJB8_CAEEX|nr:DNA N6-methyl adenine demethylase [Caerostris extrusa]
MTTQGCPLAKWIIRRSGPEEKLLTVIRHRPGHTCPTAYIIVAMVAWEGVSQHMADMMYETVVYKAGKFGNPTPRGCATNQMRTCVCQGLDAETRGACFSFGCSMNRFFSTCKFASSKFEDIHKFRLSEEIEEKEWEDQLTTLASDVALLYKKNGTRIILQSVSNPDLRALKVHNFIFHYSLTFSKITEFEEQATDCRLGIRKGRPFSGVTACIDFCAHTHTDKNNMNNGCTVVDNTDEYGSRKGQDKKIASGALEILQKFPMDFMIRSTPLQCLKKKDSKSKKRLTPEHIQAFQAALKQFVAIESFAELNHSMFTRNVHKSAILFFLCLPITK